MNYKEVLFFISKCLTVNHEPHNKKLVENELIAENINWDDVVKVSTAHYVFPALYCNLKKANYLHYLPSDLVAYMKHITDLNRERNQQIIAQAKEINRLLINQNITPIFLKGTGNLLEGLYEDVAERMVGDIDFIFSTEDYPKAITALENYNYTKVHDTTYDFPSFKHHPRLQKEGNIAAVEIHKELLVEKYADEFNFEFIKTDVQKVNGVQVLSFKNQLALSIIAKQINDKGYYYKDISLRNAYDVFLLSKKTNAITAFNDFDKLKHPLNCFLASCYEVFNLPKTLEYKPTDAIEKYLYTFYEYLNDGILRNKSHKKTSRKLFINSRLAIIYKSLFDKAHRKWLLQRTTDKAWQNEKLIALGLKKTKLSS